MKHLPKWFIITAACLIVYGWWLTFYFKFKSVIPYLFELNLISIGITLFWIFTNLFLLMFMYRDGFEKYSKEAIIIPSYYFILNTLNAFNLQFGWITEYDIHFMISVTTKTIETLVIGKLLLNGSSR